MPPERHRPGETRPPAAAVGGAGGARCRGETQPILGKKERAGGLEPGVEQVAMGVPPWRHGIGQHDRDTGCDHGVMQGAKPPRRRAGGFRLQEPVKTLAAHARV